MGTKITRPVFCAAHCKTEPTAAAAAVINHNNVSFFFSVKSNVKRRIMGDFMGTKVS